MISHCKHSLKPIINNDSKILILGSFPSIKSRQTFYYGNPYNRFWKVLEKILKTNLVNKTPEEKTTILLNNKIALYDVVEECDIVASSDSSIKNVIPIDLEKLIQNTNISHIILNGKKATELYNKYFSSLSLIAITLPSTSPANAKFSLDQLTKKWEDTLFPLLNFYN